MNSSHDTSEMICEKEKELKESLLAQREVGKALYEMDMKILELRRERKKLTESKDNADFNVRTLNADLRMLKHKYFSEKNSGI